MLCCSISRVRVRGIQAGGGRSAARCCGLFSCLYAWRGSAGDWPPVAVPCPASRCARLRDLKGMRACLAAARLRLYPDSAAAAAPPGRARSAGGAAAPPGRPSLRVARRSDFAAAALRSGRGRRSAPRLRPSAPSRRLRGSRLCPRARWAALSLSPVARGPPLRPARLPAAPCSRLRSRGGAARPLGRSLRSRPAAAWWASRPPAFWRAAARGLPLRREKRKPALRPAFRESV